jgi:hypothetical protein
MTDVTAGGPSPSTTPIKTLLCKQCAECTSGPTPGRKEYISPDGDVVLMPVCFSGPVYPSIMEGVCRNVTRWAR